MATLSNRVFDNGLTVLDTEANKILVTSQEATTYTEANETYALGNSTSLSISALITSLSFSKNWSSCVKRPYSFSCNIRLDTSKPLYSGSD